MIEILSYPKQFRRAKFECGQCGTIWLADKNDYTSLYTNNEYVAKCPICGIHIYKTNLEFITIKANEKGQITDYVYSNKT